MAESFDYVIVGSGSAGSVLATRLSEDPDVRVLVLEAGGTNKDFRVYMPAANSLAFGNPKFDWCYYTQPQPHLANRRIFWPRGRGLGGSSAINGMIYIRGNARDYDQWRQLGLEGWAYGDVLPYFKKAETRTSGGDFYRGDSGPLKTGTAGNPQAIDHAFVEACLQSGLPKNADFNGADQVGANLYDFTIADGKRSSVARMYLAKASDRPNLEVRTGSFVHELIIENGRAVGARYQRNGQVMEARADREVLVCQGAIGSPQLLMLSGIGPADDLKALGIDVKADLPGLGQNLQDHAAVAIQFTCRKSFPMHRVDQPFNKLIAGAQWMFTRTGPASSNIYEAGGLVRGNDDVDYPNLQYHLGPTGYEYEGEKIKLLQAFNIQVDQLRPRSSGHIELKSTSPGDKPALFFNYLSDAFDLQELVEGVKKMRDLVSQPAFADLYGKELGDHADARTQQELEELVRYGVTTDYHPCGTCRMGTSIKNSVVNPELKVHGVAGLRVIDASVFPNITSANTNAPTIMVAHQGAHFILSDHE